MWLKGIAENFFKTIGREGNFLLIGRFVQIINGFTISVYLVKGFGLGAMGTYTIASIATTIISLVCLLGLNYFLPKTKLSDPERNYLSMVLSAITFPFAIILVLLFALALGENLSDITTIILFSIAGFFYGQSNILNSILILQKRTILCLIPPSFTFIGIIWGVVAGENVNQLALAILLSRFLGNLILIFSLKYKPVSFQEIFLISKKSIKFLPMDFLGIISEQSVSFIMAILLTREDLGILGLCRQLVYAASMPGWSLIDSKYPKLVSSCSDIAESLKEKNHFLSKYMILAVILSSGILGVFIYEIPQFWPMCSLLALTMPARYLGNFYDKVIRAVGKIRSCTNLALIRLLLAVLIFPIFIGFFDLWGAIFGIILLTFLSLFLWKKMAGPLLLNTPSKAIA